MDLTPIADSLNNAVDYLYFRTLVDNICSTFFCSLFLVGVYKFLRHVDN